MITPPKPAWWQLYVLVPVLGGLLMLEQRAALPPGWHMGVQAGIICVVYGLVRRWVRANAYALMAGPTLYHRHDYNGYDSDHPVNATKVYGTACRWPARYASALGPRQPSPVAGRVTRCQVEYLASHEYRNGGASGDWARIA